MELNEILLKAWNIQNLRENSRASRIEGRKISFHQTLRGKIF